MSGKNIKVALQITADLNQARLAIRGLSGDISQITSGIQGLQNSQNRMSSSLDATNAGMQRLSSSVNQQNHAVRQLMVSTAAYFSLTRLKDSADAYTGLNNRLKLVTQVQDNATQSQINLKTAMEDTFAIAQGAAADWGGVASIYEKIYKNSERLGVSQQQVSSISETVAKAISNSGSSAQAASAALYQLGQSFDKGTLNGDEFVSISENAGYLMDVFAKGLNVTRAELRAMSSEGKLTTDVMTKALQNMHDKVNKDYANTQTSIGGGFAIVSNAVKKYIGETDQGAGATKVLVNALSALASNLEPIINIMGLAAWGLFTKNLIAQAVAMKERIITSQANRAAMLTEMQATVTATTAEVSRTQVLMQLTQWKLADARADMARMTGMQRLTFLQQVVLPLERQLIQATAAHTAAQAAQTAATNTLTAAKSRLALIGNGVLGVFGGPLGLAVTGASVAAMYLMMRDNTNEATQSLASQIGTVEELSKKYKQLSFTKLSAEMATIREDIKKTEQENKDALESASSRITGSTLSDRLSERQQEFKLLREQIEKGDLSIDQALQDMKQSRFKFSKQEIDAVAGDFAKLEDGRTKLESYNLQLRLGGQLLGEANDRFDQHNKNMDAQAAKVGVLESEYSRLNTSFKTQIDYAKENAANNGITKKSVDEINEVLKLYKAGTVDATKVANVFAKSGKVSPDVLQSTLDAAKAVDSKKKAVDAANESMKKTGENAPRLTKGFDEIGEGAKKAADEINGLTEEFQKYLKTAQSKTFNNTMELAELQSGKSDTQAKARVELYNLRNSDPKATQTYFVSDKELAIIDAQIQSEQKITDFKDQQKKKEEAKTKELEKQKKFQEGINRLVGLVGSTGSSTGNHLDIRYDRSYADKAVSAEHLARFQLGGKALDAKNSNSKYGNRINPVTGKAQLHRGYDFAAPAGTEVTTSYPIKDVKTFWDKKGGGWTSQVIFEDGVVINLLHQLPTMKDQIKGGSSTGKSKTEQSSDAYSLFLSQREEQNQQVEERKTFAAQFATEPEKLKAERDANIKKTNELGYDAVTKADLLNKIETEYQDKLSKRPEILKRIQDSIQQLDDSWLRASGQGLEADLNAVDEKWKQPKADIANLLMTESNPVKAGEYQNMLVRIDFVIDREKLNLKLNNAKAKFQELQNLQNSQLDNLKVQFDSGQISQPQYAEQANQIRDNLRPEMEKLVASAYEYANAMGGVSGKQAQAEARAMQLQLSKNHQEMEKFLPTTEQIQERIAGGMTDAIMAWADGTKSASDAFRQFAADFLREIAQMILKQMIFNAVKAATGYFGFADGGFTGYATGGYTGAGGKYQPAGVVHKGEVVWSQEDIKAWGGVGVVESMRKHRGYAEGGIVAAPTLQVPTMQAPIIQAPQLVDNTAQIAQSTSFNASQNFYLVDDPARILETLNSSKGQENIVVMMSRDPSKFKAALKIQG